MNAACLLFLSALAGASAAPAPEECAALLTPLPLNDRQQLSGRRVFIAGYTEHEAFGAILKITDSTRVNTSAAAHNDKDMFFYEEMMMNGTCYGSKLNISIDGNVASAKMQNISSVYHLLPACDGCQVMSINSTAFNLKSFLEAFDVRIDELSNDQISVRSLYLLAEQKTVKDEDMEQFKKQASCLGFSGEPSFMIDPKKDFCDDRKVIMIN